MKTFINLTQMINNVDEIIFKEVMSFMYRIVDTREFDEIIDLEFIEWLGGNVYVVENREDLKAVEAPTPNAVVKENGVERIKSIVEMPSAFDVGGYLEDKSYIMLLPIYNNTGGPFYYIPRHVYEVEPSVIQCLKLTTHEENPIISYKKELDDEDNT